MGGDLEVLAELLVSGLPAQRMDVFAQLVPVEIEGESVEQERLGDEVVQRKHADLLEEMGQQHVVIRLQALLQEAPERRGHGLGVEHRHDAEEALGMLGRYAPETWRRVSLHRFFIVARTSTRRLRERAQPPSPDRIYIRPTTWPSGSAKRAIVVSGATSVSGIRTLPPSFSILASTPLGSSVWT